MITLFYASLLTLLALALAFLTGRQRFKTGTNLGLGEDFGMLQITRAHGNLIENALFFWFYYSYLRQLHRYQIFTF